MAGRPTRYQREQARLRERYPNIEDWPNVPVASTIRRWKVRARARGVTPEDWDAAMDSVGEFGAIQDQIRATEAAHSRWVAAGRPWRHRDPDAPDAPVEWGRSWGYYH